MTVARVLAVALVAAMASACGALTTARRAEPTVTKPAVSSSEVTPTESDGAPSSGSVVIWTDDGTPSKPPQELYTVFSRPLDADDRAAAAFAKSDSLLPMHDSGPAADQLGRPIYAETRLVAGTTRHGLYATPTTAGAVCNGLFPNGSSGCAPSGPHGITLGWEDRADGSPFELYGMAGDDVRAVEIGVGGTPRNIEVVHNAFMLEIPHASHGNLGSVVLHLTDGTTVPLGN